MNIFCDTWVDAGEGAYLFTEEDKTVHVTEELINEMLSLGFEHPLWEEGQAIGRVVPGDYVADP